MWRSGGAALVPDRPSGRAIAGAADGHGTTVRVLANTAATASLLTAAVTSFLAAHPKARVDLGGRPGHRIVAAIAERRAELGTVADTVELGTRPRPPRPPVLGRFQEMARTRIRSSMGTSMIVHGEWACLPWWAAVSR